MIDIYLYTNLMYEILLFLGQGIQGAYFYYYPFLIMVIW